MKRLNKISIGHLLYIFSLLMLPGLVNAQVEMAGELSETPIERPAETSQGEVNGKSGSVRVSPTDRVEMHVTDAPLATVLRMLAHQSRRNIITSPRVSGTVTADLFDVTFAEALDSILMPNDCIYRESNNFIYIYSKGEVQEQHEAVQQQEPQARLFQLKYLTAKDVQPMIEPLLSAEGKIAATPDNESGLDTNPTSAGGNLLSGRDALMVFDYPDRLAQIERIVTAMDVRPQQVLVEATILQARLDEDNALGVDFNVLGGVDFEMLSSVSPGVTDLNTGQVPGGQLQNTSVTARTDFNSSVADGGFTFGIIKDQIAVFLRALEQVTETTVLANPKVLTLNKQRGVVIVGRRDGYVTTTITETTATQTVEYLETGTQLVFRPFICDDGFVRMEIHPEDSTGGLNEAQLPTERTTEVTTNIMIRDGHTILIGGLFRESTDINKRQVPLLGDLPFAGYLFQTNADSTNREEVIILLTVRIVDDEIYAEEGAHLREDVDRMRVGMREGLQWFGRNRLSMLHYRWATEHLDAGRRDQALWDVRMALHIDPGNQPALKLKDELIGLDRSHDQVGVVRDFIAQKLKTNEQANAVGQEDMR